MKESEKVFAMSDPYANVAGGGLKLKGSLKSIDKKQKKKLKKIREGDRVHTSRMLPSERFCAFAFWGWGRTVHPFVVPFRRCSNTGE